MSEIENSVVTKKYLDVIETYRPMDDVFMRNIFRESPELVEMVLRIIIDKPDLQVIRSETQADLIRITGSRGLCLDVYATDDAGKKYDVEVQKESSDMKPERARYHASAMDVENSWHGMTFDQLPDTYVIFISEKDYFGRKQPVYAIRRTVDDDNSLFNDGSNILYVNGEYRDDTMIGKLMHDFNCCNPKDMLIPELSKRTEYLKTNKKEVEHMCKQLKEMEESGISIGIEKGKILTLIQLVIEKDLSLEKAVAKSGLSFEEFLKAKAEYETNYRS